MRYSTGLAILDLGDKLDNQLSGIIPSWVGESPLEILRPRENMFHGSINWSQCDCRMQFLDLADDNLTGSIVVFLLLILYYYFKVNEVI